MIDWKKFAEINNLTPEEFQRDILTAAACVGVTLIEQSAGCATYPRAKLLRLLENI